MVNHALLKENVAICSIHNKENFLVVGWIKRAATCGDKFNRKFGSLNILIKASPHHIARRVHLWRRGELTKSLASNQPNID